MDEAQPEPCCAVRTLTTLLQHWHHPSLLNGIGHSGKSQGLVRHDRWWKVHHHLRVEANHRGLDGRDLLSCRTLVPDVDLIELRAALAHHDCVMLLVHDEAMSDIELDVQPVVVNLLRPARCLREMLG